MLYILSMEYTSIGKNDLKISKFALGTWPFAGGELWGHQDDNDSIEAVIECYENGINFFDTAPGYGDGRSEEVLGKAIKKIRNSVIIGTKIPPADLGKKNLSISVEKSLKRLGTDYIDLMQIHWPNHDIPIDETTIELENLIKSGKIKEVGVSNFGLKDMSEILDELDIVTNQLPYNAFWRAIEHDIKPFCIEKDIGIICYSTLAQGLLTGRYNDVSEVPEGVSRSRLFSKSTSSLCRHNDPGCEVELFKAIDDIKKFSVKSNIQPATIATTWLKKQSGVLTLLIGARNKSEVQLNINSFDYDIDDSVLDEYVSFTKKIKNHIGSNPDMWNAVSEYR